MGRPAKAEHPLTPPLQEPGLDTGVKQAQVHKLQGKCGQMVDCSPPVPSGWRWAGPVRQTHRAHRHQLSEGPQRRHHLRGNPFANPCSSRISAQEPVATWGDLGRVAPLPPRIHTVEPCPERSHSPASTLAARPPWGRWGLGFKGAGGGEAWALKPDTGRPWSGDTTGSALRPQMAGLQAHGVGASHGAIRPRAWACATAHGRQRTETRGQEPGLGTELTGTLRGKPAFL